MNESNILRGILLISVLLVIGLWGYNSLDKLDYDLTKVMLMGEPEIKASDSKAQDIKASDIKAFNLYQIEYSDMIDRNIELVNRLVNELDKIEVKPTLKSMKDVKRRFLWYRVQRDSLFWHINWFVNRYSYTKPNWDFVDVCRWNAVETKLLKSFQYNEWLLREYNDCIKNLVAVSDEISIIDNHLDMLKYQTCQQFDLVELRKVLLDNLDLLKARIDYLKIMRFDIEYLFDNNQTILDYHSWVVKSLNLRIKVINEVKQDIEYSLKLNKKFLEQSENIKECLINFCMVEYPNYLDKFNISLEKSDKLYYGGRITYFVYRFNLNNVRDDAILHLYRLRELLQFVIKYKFSDENVAKIETLVGEFQKIVEDCDRVLNR